MNLVEVDHKTEWDTYVREHPFGHPLQLWGWGEAKRTNGWRAHRFVLKNGDECVAGAQMLLWPIPRTGRFIAYVPRGPVVDPTSPAMPRLLNELVNWAKTHRVLYVRIEPAWTEAKLPHGWIAAAHQLQMRQTYTIDLRQEEEALLGVMARKHRQYIRKAERDGVVVRRIRPVGMSEAERTGVLVPMYEIYCETARRAGFGIHSADYYEKLLAGMGEANYLYYAEVDGRPAAFLWLMAAGETAYEMYGGITAAGQEMKANYYLKWRAMMELKAERYRIYDFNGRLNDGVSQFKQGFGPAETDYIGTRDYPLNALGYQLWERAWPFAKVIGRRIKRLKR